MSSFPLLRARIRTQVHRSELAFFQMVLCLISLTLLVLFLQEIQELSLESISWIVFPVVVSVTLLAIFVSPRGIWSGGSVYLSVFLLFHFGLVFAVFFGLDMDVQITSYLLRWFYSPPTNTAILLSCIGFAACGAGIQAAHFSSRKGLYRETIRESPGRSPSVAGLLILVVSVAGWFVTVLRTGGSGLLKASYVTFLEATKGLPMPFFYYGIGIGLVFLAASERSRYKYIGVVTFVLFSVFALPIGLRGEVLFPIVTALVVTGKRKRPISTRATILLGICFLSLIAAVRDIRHSGIGETVLEEVAGNPLRAVTELGGSLRPVSEVVLWSDMGDESIYGRSYWAPFDRALYHVLPSWTRPPIENDERVMNILVRERVGPIGFSPVAEAYRNFGMPGVVAVMFIIGAVLGRMDLWSATWVHNAAFGIIFVALLTNIRNDFTPVPFQIITGLAFLYCVRAGKYLLNMSTRRREVMKEG